MLQPIKNDIQLLLLSDSTADSNKALLLLYKHVYAQVDLFIKKNKGQSSDTEDVFQDGLLAIYKLARKGGLNPETNMEAYLFSTCRNLWFQQLRKKKIIVPILEHDQNSDLEQISLFRLKSEEEKNELQRLIKFIGVDCKKVLLAYYYKNMRMREIATAMNYSSEQVAKNKKSDCLKKLRKLVKRSRLINTPRIKS